MPRNFNQLDSERFKLLITGSSSELSLINNSQYLKNYFIENSQEMYSLFILKELGFSLEENGTYLYAKLVTKIANNLNEAKMPIEVLATQLLHDYSQFYFDIGRNDLDIGTKTFHDRIIEATSKVDYSKTDPNLVYDVFYGVSGKIDYKDQAFLIGSYISKNLKREKCKTKTMYNRKSEYV